MLLEGYDWEQAFLVSGLQAANHNDHVSTAPVDINDVDEVYASDEGENDGRDWIAYGKLKDGRYFFISAGCDYTGWDCQAGGTIYVASTVEKLNLVISAGDRQRFNEGQKA